MIYSSVIRERFRQPRFRGELTQPDASFEDVNPLCGDRIRIECRIAGGTVTDARHRGDSCAICAASADVLLERLQADVRASRMKCVTLPLTVLQGALEGREVAR